MCVVCLHSQRKLKFVVKIFFPVFGYQFLNWLSKIRFKSIVLEFWLAAELRCLIDVVTVVVLGFYNILIVIIFRLSKETAKGRVLKINS